MSLTCTKCSRVNPDEAAYCYFDGNVLAGRSRNGAPVAVSAQPFPSPFTLPTGKSCRNFDELAMACQDNWQAAKDVLQQGYLETFLGRLGRSDLAMAAKEASRFPDRDRGLDQFLTKLPSNVLDSPKLRAEPQDFSLGTVQVGQDRKFQLRLENQGMRLLYGSVTADDCVWLTLGDAPGSPQKLFQFSHDTVIPVHVRGKQLRAGNKTLEGRLLVESNGGTATVTVRLDVPVKPYPDGPLAGAKSPRQVAEKAKANPKAAAALFEKGAVAAWYKTNGWTYPVQGPSASGLGAVQQFFEALGLTPPPKVTISQRSVTMSGNPGQNLRHTLEVSTGEKRPVYAHAVSDQPWLEIGRAKLNGARATIPLVIPSVPNREGQTLTAKVAVRSNGNQRFVIPVTLTIGGSLVFGAAVPVTPAPVEENPFAPPPSAPMIVPRRPARGKSNFIHVLPLLLLLLALGGVVGYDLLMSMMRKPEDPGKPPISPVATTDKGGKGSGDKWVYDLKSRDPLLGIQFSEDMMRFGLLLQKEKDPKNPDENKRLTYQPNGSTNNTRLLVDGYDYLFGKTPEPGRWFPNEKNGKKIPIPDRLGWKSVCYYSLQKIQVTQHVEIVPGETSKMLDTCLVYYTIENKSEVPHDVGLRVMLDTFIGANDGVPFLLSGEQDFLTTQREFPDQKAVPDYVEAYENQDLNKPGTIVRIGLKGIVLPGVELEPIDRMYICRWPGNSEVLYEIKPKDGPKAGQLTAMNDPPDQPKDSCVVIFWAKKTMNPGEKRDMAFTIGLNKLAIGGMAAIAGDKKGGQIGLTARESVRPGEEFTVTAYVTNAQADKKVKIVLPRGFSLVGSEPDEKTAPPARDGFSLVPWKVRAATTEGSYNIEGTYGDAKASRPVRVKSSSLFD
jgi:hypothetical protein